jgi:hypothetical protein
MDIESSGRMARARDCLRRKGRSACKDQNDIPVSAVLGTRQTDLENPFTLVRSQVARERDEATFPLDYLDGVVTLLVCISDVWLGALDVA